MPKLTLFLASTNPGKLREFQDAAAGMDVIVRPVPGISDLPPCVEDGCTFEANARKKALHYAAHRDGLIFADDSGLSVEALNGAPGVYSARFSGPGATDESNNRKLVLHLHREAAQRADPESLRVTVGPAPLAGFPAHYTCVIALAEGERILTIVEGGCDGVILDSPHGHGGFGYDPYFFYPPLGKTFAELTPEDKFRVSHRGIAFRKLLESLSEALPERRNLN
jgi:XTP/dITP diphosphohydrolase